MIQNYKNNTIKKKKNYLSKKTNKTNKIKKSNKKKSNNIKKYLKDYKGGEGEGEDIGIFGKILLSLKPYFSMTSAYNLSELFKCLDCFLAEFIFNIYIKKKNLTFYRDSIAEVQKSPDEVQRKSYLRFRYPRFSRSLPKELYKIATTGYQYSSIIKLLIRKAIVYAIQHTKRLLKDIQYEKYLGYTSIDNRSSFPNQIPTDQKLNIVGYNPDSKNNYYNNVMWSPVPWMYIGQTINNYINLFLKKIPRSKIYTSLIPFTKYLTISADIISTDAMNTFKIISPIINLNIIIIMRFLFCKDNQQSDPIFNELYFKSWCENPFTFRDLSVKNDLYSQIERQNSTGTLYVQDTSIIRLITGNWCFKDDRSSESNPDYIPEEVKQSNSQFNYDLNLLESDLEINNDDIQDDPE